MNEFTLILVVIVMGLPYCKFAYEINQDHNPNRIEERAKTAYINSRNKIGWYKNGVHLEPWEKITEEEKEIWKAAMDNCGHGSPSND